MRFIIHQMRGHREAELTVPQFRVLVALTQRKEMTLSALAEFLGLSLPGASRMVDSLVKRGLLERQTRSNDRRQVAISLTRRGKAAFETAHAATQVAVAQSLETLSPQDLGRIQEALPILSRVFRPESYCDSVK